MNFPDLIAPLYALHEREYTTSPCHTNRASSLGSDCERALVYARTHWQEALKPDVATIILLGEGKKHEDAALEDLRRAGLQILEMQVSMEWREFQVTGHLDAVVVHEGAGIPIDVKSASEHIWRSIAFRGPGVYQWEEVKEAFTRKPWLRKYLAQITLYMLLKSVDGGIFLFVNKSTGAYAQINCRLDYDYGESLLRRAERLNVHVKAGTLPDRIEFDEEVCPRCPHYVTCLPDHVGREPIAFLDNSTVERLLDEREEHAEARAAFETADERVKSWAKAREEKKLAIGRWLLEKKPHGKGVRVDITAVSPAEPAEPQGNPSSCPRCGAVPPDSHGGECCGDVPAPASNANGNGRVSRMIRIMRYVRALPVGAEKPTPEYLAALGDVELEKTEREIAARLKESLTAGSVP